MGKKNAGENSAPAAPKYTHEINTYFGIHYGSEYIEDVYEAIKASPRFRKLESKAELQIGRFTLLASTNSDEEDRATRGMIFVDEMTFPGEEMESAKDTFMIIEPSELKKKEAKCQFAIDVVTDLYDHIVEVFKKQQIPLDLHIGWMAVSCTWEST